MMHPEPYQGRESAIQGAFPKSCQDYRLTETRGGFLNEIRIFRNTTDGSLLVIRTPKSQACRDAARALIEKDFQNSGAKAAGLDFHLRTPTEQAVFIDRCLAHKLSVIPHLGQHDEALVFPFVASKTLNLYIAEPRSSSFFSTVHAVCAHLSHAHQCGIIFGDRWGPNTFIVDPSSPMEFDFDIEIRGPRHIAAAFEMSQALYHLAHFAGLNRRSVIEYLSEKIVGEILESEEQRRSMKGFVLGFTNYYRRLFEEEGTRLEEIEPLTVDEVRSLLP